MASSKFTSFFRSYQKLKEFQSSRRLPTQLRILFCVNKYNSLSQRVGQELRERNHVIDVLEINDPNEMTELVNETQPDMIVCPFLTKRVPEEVWSNPNIPCLIVHPGIEGDRGATAIDWALKEQSKTWGVTLMQAVEEMDAGDIWSTTDFPINRPNINTLTKSSLYSNEVTAAAVQNCLLAIDNFINDVKPRPLDYSMPYVQGCLKPNMTKKDRRVDWTQSMEDVARVVRMSDSAPGAVAQFRLMKKENEWSDDMRVFGAHLEEGQLQNLKGVPGEILGQRDNAVLVKCGKGAVWISHIKRKKLKLPATYWLQNTRMDPLQEVPVEVPYKSFPNTFQEIWTSVSPEGVCTVEFEFYNGAMSTNQCIRLEAVLKELENDQRIKVIVLKGGYNFFSNGIHLNVIEHAQHPEDESWANINAINDVIKRIFMSKKITVSALQGNAGAGGAMMALASDIAVSREGVILNPHYHTMHLHGSEYHSYFLPIRVGKETARILLYSYLPLLSNEAVRIGLIDDSVGKTHEEFDAFLDDLTEELSRTSIQKEYHNKKKDFQNEDWFKTLDEHKRKELFTMSLNFRSEEYHKSRKAFVYH